MYFRELGFRGSEEERRDSFKKERGIGERVEREWLARVQAQPAFSERPARVKEGRAVAGCGSGNGMEGSFSKKGKGDGEDH